ncbi:response regulator [Massilia sp. LXY-6]|uniref:response regulator n=1 Tax=Massilia sp. LXY-6 TaxID=3379823 RepID=UPI003EE0FC28
MHSTSDTAGESPKDRSVLSDNKSNGVDALLRKVLLVDDEADGAELAAALLGAHGLEVLVVHSAHEALELLQRDKDIGAILTDVMMPGMTGLQLAEAVREMYPAVKIVLMSGYVVPELLKNRERPYLFAEKPYRIETILKLLRS